MNGIFVADIGAAVAALSPTEALLLARQTVSDMLRCLLPCAELLHGAAGAPYLSKSTYRVSVSHCDGLVAVALYEGAAVGVDVERIVSNEARAARMEKRFLGKLPAEPTEKISHFPVYAYKKTKENENNSFHFEEIITQTDEKTAKDAWVFRWTQLEAVLKMSGDGFASYAHVGALWEQAALATFSLSDGTGERYAVSLALPRER